MEEIDALKEVQKTLKDIYKTVEPSGTVALLRPAQLKHLIEVQEGVLKWAKELAKAKV